MTKPINEATPAQIGSVTGIDRMDTIDRAKLDPRVKLELLCVEMKNTCGRDPRAGGFAFVARPRVWRQFLIDLNVGPLSADVRLQNAVVVDHSNGTRGDIVGWWKDVPLMVRCNVKDDSMYAMPLEQIPKSKPVDRNTAGRLRMAAHYGKLAELGDN